MPDWLKQEIPLQRLIQLTLKYKGKTEGNKATDAEVLAYLYTANLSIPISSEYAEIYFYLGRKSLKWQGKTEVPDFLKDCENIDEYKTSLLDKLKIDIWNVQEKAFKEKLKEDKKEIKKQNKNIEQISLFE